MTLLIISFIAGILTVLAPCVLPLLPVVIGTSASGRSKWTPYIIVASLGVSIILFTYLLKFSTAFIMVPPEVWTSLSGGILLLFGITLLFPAFWEHIPGLSKISIGANKLFGVGYQKKSFWGDVIVGASLGPIFSTCSPTYFVILASVLPASFLLGSLYLFAYTIGLMIVLLLIALLGERFSAKLSGISNPRGWFKRSIGVVFVILGLAIIFGYEKKLETAILDSGYFDITKIETKLLQKLDAPENSGTSYIEIKNPAGFVNTNDQPIKIADYVGKKVILLDIMTYSCINCQRTFPYAVAWYEKYKDDGFIIIGIHTPEFAFEKNKDNVIEAMKRFGITFPVVLDNDYGTWNAYGNHYWPRKYLIDIHGNIVYDHIGEGAYEETEMKIRELLAERAQVLGESVDDMPESLVVTSVPKVVVSASSPETYIGSARNELLANGTSHRSGKQNFILPDIYEKNKLYLGGSWNMTSEYGESISDARIAYRYHAKEVYLVMDANTPTDVEVWQDGVLYKTITVKASQLYTIMQNDQSGEHTIELRIKGAGLRAYAFTFG